MNRAMFRSVETALGFLTVFKVRNLPLGDMAEVGKSAWVFPLVGALIGLILTGTYYALSTVLPSFLTAILTVGLWIFLTGGLHLDGWTDCWDALATSVSPERRYEILKDPRLGTFGAVALMILLAVKTSALACENFPPSMIFLAPIVSRGVMVTVSYRGRTSIDGMAAAFISALSSRSVLVAGILGFTPALLWGMSGVAALGFAYLGSLWFKRLVESRLSTFNGDAIGAICEFSEAIILLVACIKW